MPKYLVRETAVETRSGTTWIEAPHQEAALLAFTQTEARTNPLQVTRVTTRVEILRKELTR